LGRFAWQRRACSRKPGQCSCKTGIIQEGKRPSVPTTARTHSVKASQPRYSCCTWEKRFSGTRSNCRVARRRASSWTRRSVLPGCHRFGLLCVRPTLRFMKTPITQKSSPHITGNRLALQRRADACFKESVQRCCGCGGIRTQGRAGMESPATERFPLPGRCGRLTSCRETATHLECARSCAGRDPSAWHK